MFYTLDTKIFYVYCLAGTCNLKVWRRDLICNIRRAWVIQYTWQHPEIQFWIHLSLHSIFSRPHSHTALIKESAYLRLAYGAGETAETSSSVSTGSRKRDRDRRWDWLWPLKFQSSPQWHTCSSKVIPPNASQALPFPMTKHPNLWACLWEPLLSILTSYLIKLFHLLKVFGTF